MLRLAQMNSHGNPQMGFSATAGSFWGLHLQDKALEAGTLVMDIMQNNEAECWEISD